MITIETPFGAATWKHSDQPIVEPRRNRFMLAERATDLDLLAAEKFALARYERCARLDYVRAGYGHRVMAAVCSQLRAERRGGDAA